MSVVRKTGRVRSMTANSERSVVMDAIKPLDRKKNGSHFVAKKEPPESIAKKKEVYLTANCLAGVSLPKKKKPTLKERKVTLSGTGLKIEGSSSVIEFSLDEFCMLHQELALSKIHAVSPSIASSSPFGKPRKRKENYSDKTMLLCTRNLSRIWIRFSDKLLFIKWFLCIDGLIGIFYHSSLLNPLNKVFSFKISLFPHTIFFFFF